MTRNMNRICSYCGNKYGCRIGDKIKDCLRCDNMCTDSDVDTHGICPKCFDTEMNNFKRGGSKCSVQKRGSG